MPSDRGTMQRGLTSDAQNQGVWQEPVAAPSRRLPSARRARRLPRGVRERKPARAALALLPIASGALSAGLLVIQSGKRVAAIEISQQVGAGQRIPVSAMQEVQVASGTGLGYVPWAEASQVARFYAATTIPPGTLLTSAMVAQASGVTAGKDVLGLALKDGQLPDQLKVGDHVGIYAVSGQNSTSAGCPGSGGGVLASDARDAALRNVVPLSVHRCGVEGAACATGVFMGGSGLVLTTYDAIRGADGVEAQLAAGRRAGAAQNSSSWGAPSFICPVLCTCNLPTRSDHVGRIVSKSSKCGVSMLILNANRSSCASGRGYVPSCSIGFWVASTKKGSESR